MSAASAAAATAATTPTTSTTAQTALGERHIGNASHGSDDGGGNHEASHEVSH
jgi:hypothetical protein